MRHLLAVALAALLAMTAPSVRADEPGASAWVAGESGRVRLVSATVSVPGTGSLRLGVQFDLSPGWKIYWRTPGDAGIPPSLDWAGSDNLGAVEIFWPAPKRFVLAGLQNHGYEGEVILPLAAAVPRPGQAVGARARLEFLACAQLCVPQQADLALDLPAGDGAPSAFAHQIGRFAARVPGDGARHGLALEQVAAVDGERLHVLIRSDVPLDHPDLFVEGAETANFDQPEVMVSEGGRLARFEVPVVPGTRLRDLVGAPLRLTMVDGARAFQADAVVVPGRDAGDGALALMLAAALLGGLILNLMPCVLPVLSLKVLGVLGHGGGERRHVRVMFLAAAAGIVVSFLALGAILAGLKAGGVAVGWGIQFQQPLFLAALIVLLLAFAANLWGWYEIALPGWLAGRVAAVDGARHHTALGHFLSGAFATILATPCSAPFLGTAVGFALARGPLEIGAIFAALGAGMAGPYLLLAALPGLATRLPRPGRWMVRLRVLLGVALAATALWLGGVLLAVILPASPPAAGQALAWRDFDRAAIAPLVAEGKIVFVDVTADWCITCKVNKAAVVERGAVAARLSQPGVVALRADWTRPDDAIARYLAEHGRYGIPFNAIYGPGAPDGIVLSELLTESELLAALDKAKGERAGR